MADSMTESVHQRIADPVFRWPASGWWLTGISAVIGCVLFVWPRSIELSFPIRTVICVAVVLLPAITLALRHVWRRHSVFHRRVRAYGDLVTSLEDANCELHRAKEEAKSELERANNEAQSKLDRAGALISTLLREREQKNSLRIAYCYVYHGKPLIALKGKRGFSANVGDPFTVVDLEAGNVLGTFEVTEKTGDHWIASGSGHIDALWFGYMKLAGSTRSEPPPNARAIRLSVEEDRDDRENAESTT